MQVKKSRLAPFAAANTCSIAFGGLRIDVRQKSLFVAKDLANKSIQPLYLGLLATPVF
jgi:hypothetical protein